MLATFQSCIQNCNSGSNIDVNMWFRTPFWSGQWSLLCLFYVTTFMQWNLYNSLLHNLCDELTQFGFIRFYCRQKEVQQKNSTVIEYKTLSLWWAREISMNCKQFVVNIKSRFELLHKFINICRWLLSCSVIKIYMENEIHRNEKNSEKHTCKW